MRFSQTVYLVWWYRFRFPILGVSYSSVLEIAGLSIPGPSVYTEVQLSNCVTVVGPVPKPLGSQPNGIPRNIEVSIL